MVPQIGLNLIFVKSRRERRDREPRELIDINFEMEIVVDETMKRRFTLN